MSQPHATVNTNGHHDAPSSRSSLAGTVYRRYFLGAISWRGWRAAKQRPDGLSDEGEAVPARLASYHFVADVVRWYPQTIEVLARVGFTPIRSALLRATLARRITLAQAAMIGRVPLATLLEVLNDAIDAPPESDAAPAAACSGLCHQCSCSTEHTAPASKSPVVGAHV
ncbi:DUF1858 domain-containing protein [Phycisphaerales bacterium AB-hyl4]|uniref:DUF1858 domain-containing protein n=1 Tax=Natronomicrosphaera hydrolytica TaxID=3242702 RepID=A0ABV4U568_9BACT